MTGVGPCWGHGGVVMGLLWSRGGPDVRFTGRSHPGAKFVSFLVATKFDSMGDMLIWPTIMASENTANFNPIFT